MSETTTLVIPGQEFDAADHADDMASILRVAEMFGVRVATTLHSRCGEFSPGPHAWVCTRADGHSRRHVATYADGDPRGALVLAVWHQTDW